MRKLHFFLILLVFFTNQVILGQNISTNTEGNNIAKATEFSIPTSPAFDLLGVTPSQVIRPTNIREFKVDWSFRSWRLKPNIALQTQPIWEIFYNKGNINRYRKASPLMRTLSTLDLSGGTVEGDDQLRRVALSAKINLYREKDPLLDRKLFLTIDTSYRKIQEERISVIYALNDKIKREKLNRIKKEMQTTIDSVENHYDKLETEQKIKIQNVAQEFAKENWNSSHVDLAYGRVLNYRNVATLDSLALIGEAKAVWLNASKGFGKKILVTGLMRYIVQDDTSKIKQKRINKSDTIAINPTKGNIFSFGLSFRYGGPKFSFFVESVYSHGNRPLAITNPTFNITKLGFFSISYGGDWRINRNIILSYGVRTDYNQDFKFKTLIPVASIACMMR